MTRKQNELRRIPAVSRLLLTREIRRLARRHGERLVTDLVRERLADLRGAVAAGRIDGGRLRAETATRAVARAVGAAAEEALGPRPRPVINATGVVVHTNLGRAVLSPAAARHLAEAASGYLDLEYDLARGARGSRLDHLAPLMERLFPGQAFAAFNNNAAAVLVCLRALARRKEVLISRGELVEIGGSFRVPDVLAASGARLREVGTTNRTRAADYEAALSPRTGLILRVHASNFRVVGFTEAVPLADLARVARRSGLPLVVDQGSGDLVDLAPLGLRDELPAARVLAAGADLVTFSGDKLLGGPQSGFVVGRRELVERVRRDPLARVCRLDRLAVGALHATLAAHVRGRALEEVPTLRMLSTAVDELDRRARRVRRDVARRSGAARLLQVIDGESRTGGGSSPTGVLPTRLLAVSLPAGDAGRLDLGLRTGRPPVVGRVQGGRLLLDLRTVLPEQERALADRLVETLSAEVRR